ncbi:MAG: hypothetical protein ACRC1Z_26100 [Waterburya sp.]
MDVYIAFESKLTEKDSDNLEELANLIQEECDVSLEIERNKSEPGVKDGGIAIAISIASLTLSLVQTLIQILQYWESKQKTYSISITDKNLFGSKTILLKNLSSKEIQLITEQFRSQSQTKKIEVNILKD